jgi:hypothetical protein
MSGPSIVMMPGPALVGTAGGALQCWWMGSPRSLAVFNNLKHFIDINRADARCNLFVLWISGKHMIHIMILWYHVEWGECAACG